MYYEIALYLKVYSLTQTKMYNGWTDHEKIRSRINNNDCRTFWPRRPLSTAYLYAVDKRFYFITIVAISTTTNLTVSNVRVTQGNELSLRCMVLLYCTVHWTNIQFNPFHCYPHRHYVLTVRGIKKLPSMGVHMPIGQSIRTRTYTRA